MAPGSVRKLSVSSGGTEIAKMVDVIKLVMNSAIKYMIIGELVAILLRQNEEEMNLFLRECGKVYK